MYFAPEYENHRIKVSQALKAQIPRKMLMEEEITSVEFEGQTCVSCASEAQRRDMFSSMVMPSTSSDRRTEEGTDYPRLTLPYP